MALHPFNALILGLSLMASPLLASPVAEPAAQTESACGEGSATCLASCARFENKDPRFGACEKVCLLENSTQCAREPASDVAASASVPEQRAHSKKGDALHERELNGRMVKAIQHSDLREMRRLIEMNGGLNPTYAYDFEFNPDTRQYEGRAVKLRLADVLNDANPNRRDDEGIDKIVALLIELGLDVTATLPANANDSASTTTAARTAWGPSLTFMERAKDRESRLRAFELALEKGLKPNDDIGQWLFAELPQVCGRDRSQFAIRIVDLLVKHLGTSLQDDFWRLGGRGPETIADVLDRLMSPGRIPRSNAERAEFAEMDAVWENCAPLSHRINRYLQEGI